MDEMALSVSVQPNTSVQYFPATPRSLRLWKSPWQSGPRPGGNHQRILRIGHRGAAGHAPENTIAAIRRGISLGVDFVELDVQRTRDERLLVMHDKLVDRTTDGTGLVSEMTWDELQVLDLAMGKGCRVWKRR